MRITNSTYFVLVVALTVMVLSVTVFEGGKNSTIGQQNSRTQNVQSYQDRKERFPVAEFEEVEPSNPVTKARLRKQKSRYDKDAPFFTHGSPQDEEIAFRPEWQFDFPALPVAKSDVIVIGQVLDAQAHRSHNKRNVFSNFSVRVDEVIKGSSLTKGSVITIQRVGGYVKYPNGQKILFRLSGNGMPAVGGRYALFLNLVDEDYSILTGYELTPQGVVPLDDSRQFHVYQGQNETDFVKTLRNAASHADPEVE